MRPALGAGALTLLSSGFEDSARLWDAAPEAMARASAIYRGILSEAAAQNRGVELAGQGEDVAVIGFRHPPDALSVALEAQRAAGVQEWPDGLDLRVRTALHTAEVNLGLERNHLSLSVGRCSRLLAVARGGQILLSRATHELVASRLPDGVELVDLGVHRLPDLGLPEHVYGVIDSDLPEELEPPRSVDTSPNNLPSGLTTFVGRERELAELRRELEAARLLTVIGPGGCGKTRLAQQAAADLLERFQDGVWWVDLAPVADPAMVGQAIADALGGRALPGQSALETAVAHLSARRALVLLDNCEHLLPGVAKAAEALLMGCPGATILATSRAPLGLPAETRWYVPSLSLPKDGAGDPLRALAGSDAARLFVERATEVRPDFTVAEATAPALAEVCSELDGIPLAIELAAARVRLLSVEQIAAGLSDRFRLLTGGAPTALPRHRTLRASVDWSHDLLTPEERTLLRRLGVFVGGFTLEAAEQVCAPDDREGSAIIDVLASLVDKSLVVVDDERGRSVRFRLLETVREYELEYLRETEELEAIRDRHRDFFLALAERVAPALLSAKAHEELDALDEDGANLDAALWWAIETDGERALRLCAALIWWWMRRGLFALRDAACARALEAAGREPSSLHAQVLTGRAHLLTYAGRYEAATAVAHEALEVAEEVGDPAEIGRALEALGKVATMSSEAAVHPVLKRARELLRESGEDLLLVTTTQTMAWGHLRRAEYDEGEALLEEVFPIVERMGNPDHLRWHWMGMALRHESGGNGERFFELAGRALEVAREIGDPRIESFTHAHIARVEIAQGRAAEARARLEAIRERTTAAGAGLALARTEFMLAGAEAALGDLDGARARLEAVAATIPDGGIQLGSVEAQLADILRVSGDAAGAEDWARKGLDANERVPDPRGISWCKEILGWLAADRGDWSQAEALLHDALALRAEKQLWLWLPQTLDALAVVAAGLGARERAARLLGAAERTRSDLGLVRWAPDQPRLEALTRDLRLELGHEAFRVAWSEGERLTLEEAVSWIRRARGSRKRPPDGWESLTPTELEVAGHAATGLTNAEIGRAMFISPGTVKTHLSHIYAKLGLRNRAQLTAEASARRAASSRVSA